MVRNKMLDAIRGSKLILAMCFCSAFAIAAYAEAASTPTATHESGRWMASQGLGTVDLNPEAMERAGMRLIKGSETWELGILSAASNLRTSVSDAGEPAGSTGGVRLYGSSRTIQVNVDGEIQDYKIGNLHVSFHDGEVVVTDLADLRREIFQVNTPVATASAQGEAGSMSMTGQLVISPSFAEEILHDVTVANTPVGTISIEIALEPSTAQRPVSPAEPSEGGEEAEPRSAGPDVIVGGVGVSANGTNTQDQWNWGALGGIRAYSVATTSCNIGTSQLLWQQSSQFHPVIGQSVYRLKDGRFEHIGQSWLKHGFCALGEFLCGGCPNDPDGCPTLDPQCSDPYTANRNGTSTFGPKFQVNASTGVFNWPPQAPAAPSTVIRARLQIHVSDIDPTLNPGALYFAEAQYVTQDDAANGNKDNNASRRRVTFNPATNLTMSFPENTVQQEPAIFAWPTYEPGVTMRKVNVLNDGKFWVAYHATEVTPGVLWHYEYAVHNLNSHRSGQSFSVPVPAGVNITNIGFHDVDYHSGEPEVGTDWPGVVSGGAITWACDAFTAGNANSANAIRWGTLYNFRFDADTGPQDVSATLGLFRPPGAGEPTSMSVLVSGPLAQSFNCSCPGDLNASSTVDGDDIAIFTSMYVGESVATDCSDMALPHDHALNSDDVDSFVNRLMLDDSACQ